ncbi:uncharacterized protein LOC144170121 [Haemaphysalis longicornis]
MEVLADIAAEVPMVVPTAVEARKVVPMAVEAHTVVVEHMEVAAVVADTTVLLRVGLPKALSSFARMEQPLAWVMEVEVVATEVMVGVATVVSQASVGQQR